MNLPFFFFSVDYTTCVFLWRFECCKVNLGHQWCPLSALKADNEFCLLENTGSSYSWKMLSWYMLVCQNTV